jgi:3-oxoacyl-[acyl-carrier-protein] synthase-3
MLEQTLPTASRVGAPQTLRGAGMVGIGTAIPEGVVTSAEIAARIGIEEEWILTRTGIRERRRAEPHERLSDYAAAAGRMALQRAGIAPGDVDLVLVATMSQDELTPNAAPLVAHALGATRAGAIDVGAACTAWLSGLALASSYVETGRADHVLVIGADMIGRFVDPTDRGTAPLFSDGAGAVVVSPTTGRGRMGPVILGADGAEGPTLYGDWDDRILHMDGPRVFKHAVMRMKDATVEALAAAELDVEDIDLFVYHQANARILKAIGDRLGIAESKLVSTIETLGNNSAATLPIALAAAEADGRLVEGSRVLLSAFGAGFTWGATVVEWGLADA